MGTMAASRLLLCSFALLPLAVAGCNMRSESPAKQVASEQAKPTNADVDDNDQRPPVPALTPTPNEEHEESDDPFSDVVEQEDSKPFNLDNMQGDSSAPRITKNIDNAHLIQIELSNDALTLDLASNGDSLVVGYRDGSIKFHDIETWDVKKELIGAEYPISAIALTPDGRLLVSAGGDDDHGELKLWDLADDKPARSLPAHEYEYDISEVAISPDGQYVLSNCLNETLLIPLEDPDRQRYFGSGDSSSNFRRLMEFTPDGAYAVLADGKGEAEVVQMETFEKKEFRAASGCASGALVIVTDGRGLILGDNHGRPFRSWDFEGNPRVEYSSPEGGIASLALTADGKYLIGGGAGFSGEIPIRVWERSNGRIVAQWDAHSNRISKVMIARNGAWIVSKSWDHPNVTINVWSLSKALKQHAFKDAAESVKLTESVTSNGTFASSSDTCISSDGNLLYTIESEKVEVQDLRRLDQYNMLRTLTKLLPDGAAYFEDVSEAYAEAEREQLTHLELSADDNTLLTADGRQRIQVWDIPTRTLRKTHALHDKLIDVLVVSPDGKSFVSADVGSSEVACRDTESGRTKWKAELPGGLDHLERPLPRPVRFSSDGKLVAMAAKSSVRFFDALDGTLRRGISTQIESPTGLALSPDGRLTAISGSPTDNSDDSQLSLFAGEKRLWTERNQENRLKVFDFSADGRHLFNALGGKNVEVRTASDGAFVRALSPKDSQYGSKWNLVTAARANSFVLARNDVLVAAHLPHLLDAELLAVVDRLKARNVEIFSEGKRVMFDFEDSSATDADLAVLAKLKTPFRVRLESDNLTDAALAHLHGQDYLVGADLSGGEFTDEGVAHLAGLPNVRELTLDSGDGITDRSMEVIGGFANLDRLSVQFTGITGSSFHHLQELPRLRELALYADNITAADMHHLAGLTELRTLDMSHAFKGASAETLQSLASLKKLEHLHLSACGLKDDGIELIAGLRELRTLDLSDNEITGAGCRSLAGLSNLQALQLNENPIDDAGLAQLTKLKRLRTLDISDTNVAGDNLAGLARMTDLREIKLNDLSSFTGRDLGVLAGALRLKLLNLSGTTVGDEGLQQLALVTQLETLYLPPNMTDAGFAPLAKLTNLQRLHVHPLAKITGEGLKHLESLPNLRLLDLNRTQITDKGLAAISRLNHIDTLYLQSTKISDTALQHLVNLPKLRLLELGYTAVSDDALPYLAKIESLETVGLEDTKTTEAARRKLDESNDRLFVRD